MGGYKTLCQPTRPSLMTSATQFHVFLPWGKAPGEGPSRGLLCDCTTSPINRFAALLSIDTPPPVSAVAGATLDTNTAAGTTSLSLPASLRCALPPAVSGSSGHN